MIKVKDKELLKGVFAEGAVRALQDNESPEDTANVAFDEFDEFSDKKRDEILDYVEKLLIVALDPDDLELIKQKIPKLYKSIIEGKD